MARILLFGAGSVGAVYIYVFTKGGAEVTAVCRSNYAAAKANGFTINSSFFGDVHVHPNVVQDVSEASGPFDFVVVVSKSMPGLSPSQAELIKPAVGPETAIVLLQNGIAIEDEYASMFPENPIISGVVYIPATQTAPAVVLHKEIELLYLGTFPAAAPPPHKAAVEALAAIITAGGGTAKVQDDVQLERWSKLMVNAAWNPTCALTRSRDAHFIASSPGAVDFVRKVMLEVAAVAQAAGYPTINEEMVKFQLGRATARKLPGVEPSMMADALAGRAMEVEAIVGNTVRLAKGYKIETPLLEALYTLAKALNAAGKRARVKSD